MNYIKKFILASCLVLFVITPIIGYAEEGIISGEEGGFNLELKNPLKVDTVVDLIKALLGILIQIGLPIAAIAIIYSGFLMVTAQGNEEKLGVAKKALLYSVIGTLILLGAWVIITAIENTIKLLQ